MAVVTVPENGGSEKAAVTMDDAALFASATANEAPADPPAQEPAAEPTEQPQEAGQPRDEHGRFAPKAEQQPVEQSQTPEPVQAQQPAAQPQDAIPPWRLREEAEARRAAENRAAALEQQFLQTQAQLRQFTEKKPEPIDPLLDFDGAYRQRSEQALHPLLQQMADTREYFSRKSAIKDHGEQTVREAYQAFDQAIRARDPSIAGLVQRIQGGPDPFEDIVSWHKQAQIVKDPRAYALSQIGEWAKDPQQKAAILAALNGQPAPQQQQPGNPSAQPTNVVKLPPSLSKAPGSASEPTGSMADADLYAFATGRT